MLKRIFKTGRGVLGLDLKPGDKHYRAFVGPPEDYDLVSAMVFNLVTCLGLRQNHRVLDIGCGSLRNGRLLIPYLNRGNYFGLDPNRWLIREGVRYEVGNDLLKIKRPVFFYADSLGSMEQPLCIDFAIAQSIFSHTGLDLMEKWFSEVAFHLKDDGILLATFLIGETDSDERGWIYPGCVEYDQNTISELSGKFGLNFKLLNWYHPRQSWALFYKGSYNTLLIDTGDISWNRMSKTLLNK